MMFAIGPDRDLLVRTEDPDGHVDLWHLTGWIVGVHRETSTMHAVDAEQAFAQLRSRSRRTTVDAVCGARVRLYSCSPADARFATALWPPRVRTLVDGVSRCLACHEATGRPRPSGYFPPKDAA
jgi:hypothetical protein